MKNSLNNLHRTPNLQRPLIRRLPALNVRCWMLVVGCFFPLFILSVVTAPAQRNTPQIGYVYPAGARIGAILELNVGGQFLQGATKAFVTGGGIEAVVTDFNRPMPQGQFNKLRDRMQELREKRQTARKDDAATNTWTSADEQEMAAMRDLILKNPPNRNATQAIADVATLRVTIATNAAPGAREIRLATATGLSNPMKFYVGTLPEFSAPPARAPNPEEDRLRRQFNLPPAETPNTNIARVTLPTVINGQIMPGELDRYRFSARRGQSLVVVVSARDLIPYLADAVPGWFQATVALYDAKGQELAYNDDFRSQPDPVLHFAIPRDGDYFVEIKDSIYRGREDFVYRISLGELPFVTSIFPLGGRVGERTAVQLKGWNLSTNSITSGNISPGVTFLAAPNGSEFSNLVPFAIEDWPEVREREPNNDSTTAQQITLPLVINGRIDQPGDADVFQITGTAGDEIVVEVTARRLNSPLDSILIILDASGQQLALNDDQEDLASGLQTHHADSYLRVKLSADGKHFIQLGDTQRQGGPEFGYRLRLSAPRPDFELRAVPASLSVRSGDSVAFRVVALRQDGFTNDIIITLTDAPAGFKLSTGRITTSTNEVQLTLTASFATQAEPCAISFLGRASVDGKDIVRPVVPAENQMQAFFYRHLVPAQELQVKVIRRPGAARRNQSR